jgi:hypothetical protein
MGISRGCLLHAAVGEQQGVERAGHDHHGRGEKYREKVGQFATGSIMAGPFL